MNCQITKTYWKKIYTRPNNFKGFTSRGGIRIEISINIKNSFRFIIWEPIRTKLIDIENTLWVGRKFDLFSPNQEVFTVVVRISWVFFLKCLKRLYSAMLNCNLFRQVCFFCIFLDKKNNLFVLLCGQEEHQFVEVKVINWYRFVSGCTRSSYPLTWKILLLFV